MGACYWIYTRGESIAGTFWRLDWKATKFTASTNRYLGAEYPSSSFLCLDDEARAVRIEGMPA